MREPLCISMRVGVTLSCLGRKCPGNKVINPGEHYEEKADGAGKKYSSSAGDAQALFRCRLHVEIIRNSRDDLSQGRIGAHGTSLPTGHIPTGRRKRKEGCV